MKEVYGYLWKYPADIRVITTNGTIKSDGRCVMGRGCAEEAARLHPLLPYELGKNIRMLGNIMHFFPQYLLVSFPVKHHWYEKADIRLIEKSTEALKSMALQIPDRTILMPRAGCGNGKLNYLEVKPVLDTLPDNVLVITYGEQ